MHAAGWVNWHAKCEKLEFYHDEDDKVIPPKRPRKPRRRKTESEDSWEARLKEWEALLPHEVEVKPKGNTMTQKYYVERLLPVYATAIQEARLRDNRPWILQEDNDHSHGHRIPKNMSTTLAKTYRDSNWIDVLIHPPQSPDLNPIEACWNIIKPRLRHRVWHDLEELKIAIQEE